MFITKSRIEKDFAFIQLKEVHSVEEAEELAGLEFVISPDQILPPEEGFYYPFQLMGMDVFTEDNQWVGVVTEVYTIRNQEVIQISNGKKEYLIPGTRNIVKKIIFPEKKIIIHAMEGLLS